MGPLHIISIYTVQMDPLCFMPVYLLYGFIAHYIHLHCKDGTTLFCVIYTGQMIPLCIISICIVQMGPQCIVYEIPLLGAIPCWCQSFTGILDLCHLMSVSLSYFIHTLTLGSFSILSSNSVCPMPATETNSQMCTITDNNYNFNMAVYLVTFQGQ